jgi:hypothetical protein
MVHSVFGFYRFTLSPAFTVFQEIHDTPYHGLPGIPRHTVHRLDYFHKQHLKTILIMEPFVVNTSLQFDNSQKYHAVDSAGNPFLIKDFYFGQGGLIDIFRKENFRDKKNMTFCVGKMK